METPSPKNRSRRFDPPPSYLKSIAESLAILAALLGLWGYRAIRERPGAISRIAAWFREPEPSSPALSTTGERPSPVSAPSTEPPIPLEAVRPAVPEKRPPAPKRDRAAIAKAEAALDAAKRDRERAESRLEDAQAALSSLAIESAATALDRRTKSLEASVRQASLKLGAAKANGEKLKADRAALERELAALTKIPRPKPRSLVDKSPVATASDGHETFFEIRRDRIAFVDVDRLIEMVKAETRKKMGGESLDSDTTGKVGPVGWFAMRYEISRSVSDIDDLISQRVTLGLRSFEIVPLSDIRGETYETALRPTSEFTRALHRVSPGRSMITLWVYPDGFALYRKVRDALHSRGYLVAARPLPDGVPIRGSTIGSVSAGQ